jgi:hypothetical protein
MEFFNHRYTIICKEEIDVDWQQYIPVPFDIYVGTLEECYTKIKRKEIHSQKFYVGHLIVNSLDALRSFDSDISKFNLNDNCAYFEKVTHAGPHNKNKVDESLILCNSWNLPFIVSNYRSNNTLYANLRRHRVKIFQFKNNLKDNII